MAQEIIEIEIDEDKPVIPEIPVKPLKGIRCKQRPNLLKKRNIKKKITTDLNVSISNMHNKKLVIYNEPAEHDTVKTSTVKALTGCKNIAARGLYKSSTETNLCGTHIMICNKKPLLDTVDDAIANRIIVIPFRSMFRNKDNMAKLPADTPYLFESNEYYKTNIFIEDMKLPFINILLSYYQIFKNEGCILKNIPKSIKEMGDDYLTESDDFYSWFLTRYENTESKDNFVKISDVYKVFITTEFYTNLSRLMRNKKYTPNKFIILIKENPNLKGFYRERHTHKVDGTRIENTNVLLMFQYKISNGDD
jgi:phage/plasmid-associated DNA primase